VNVECNIYASFSSFDNKVGIDICIRTKWMFFKDGMGAFVLAKIVV